MLPIRSLYYLLCYAWDHADLASRAEVGGVRGDRAADLLGHVLAVRAAELMRRGLHREYTTHDEDLRSPRGKIDVAQQIKRMLSPSGRAACVVDELDHDVLPNRILRTGLMRLSTAVSDPSTARSLRNLGDRMPVSTIEPSPAHFTRLRLHRLSAHYAFVLHVCELVFRSLMPDRGGAWRFVDFTGNERVMGLLFEGFVRKFLTREQTHFRVGRDRIRWLLEPITEGSAAVLPEMQTDITLRAPGRRVIVETKFYGEPLRRGRHDDSSRRLREAHLYQLFAYLRHMETAGRAADAGVLLYATRGERFDHRYRFHDQELRACTLDLEQPWEGIAADLHALAESLAETKPAAVSGA